MRSTKWKSLRTCLYKWRKSEFRTPTTTPSSSPSYSSACESCGEWAFRPSGLREDSFIPRDVPRGHLAVYVGENYRRFVIKITLLDHPLFRALLDQARDEYGLRSSSKLWIPCDESMFVEVVRCAGRSSSASEGKADCCYCFTM